MTDEQTPHDGDGPHHEEMLSVISNEIQGPKMSRAQKRREALFDEMWEEWADAAREQAANSFAYHDCHAGSDLERLLLLPLMFMRPSWVEGGYGGPLDLPQECRVIPQYKAGRYTIDFAVHVGPFGVDRKEFWLAVECDGQYFHDRTPEQVARDKRRDRYLTFHGWRVVRFTEAEILDDPRACADQVPSIIESLLGARNAGGDQ